MAEEVKKMMAQGNSALQKCQPDLAVQFFQRALEKTGNADTDIMDTLADTYLQMGDPENALALLQNSIRIAPESSAYKYLYIAQLQDGADALISFQRAIALLARDQELAAKAAAAGGTNADGEDVIKRAVMIQKQHAKAYCSIADLYLTDLCEEVGAEQACEEALRLASTVDADGLDMLQTLASLRISQCRNEDACVIIQGVFNRVHASLNFSQQASLMSDLIAQAEAAKNGTVFAGGAGDDKEAPEDECPEHHFCISTAKILVECAIQQPVLAENAMELVQLLLEEDDDNTELWYIMGVAALGINPPDEEAAKYHLEKAKEMMLEAQERYGEENEEQVCLVDQHLAMIVGDCDGMEEDQEVDEEADN